MMLYRDSIDLFRLITSNFLNVVSIAIDALDLRNMFVLQTTKAAGPHWGCTRAARGAFFSECIDIFLYIYIHTYVLIHMSTFFSTLGACGAQEKNCLLNLLLDLVSSIGKVGTDPFSRV